MAYNAHLLLHLVDTAKNWGPLWGYSLYPFEAMNGSLRKFVQGTRYANIQIVQKFCILQSLSKLWMEDSQHKAHYRVNNALKCLIKGYVLRKKVLKVDSALLIGKGTLKTDGTEHQKMCVGAFTFCTSQHEKS